MSLRRHVRVGVALELAVGVDPSTIAGSIPAIVVSLETFGFRVDGRVDQPASCDDFAFVPGQYLTLRATVDGADIRRSYSICSARSSSELEVGIKQVPQGRF